MLGGFFRSLQFTSINALAYAEVPTSRMSRATALSAVGQQVSLATGVAVGALTVEIVVRLKGQCRNHGVGFSAGLPAGRLDRGELGLDLHAAAAERRRRDGQPGAADHRGVGPADGMMFSAAPGMLASRAARR